MDEIIDFMTGVVSDGDIELIESRFGELGVETIGDAQFIDFKKDKPECFKAIPGRRLNAVVKKHFAMKCQEQTTSFQQQPTSPFQQPTTLCVLTITQPPSTPAVNTLIHLEIPYNKFPVTS